VDETESVRCSRFATIPPCILFACERLLVPGLRDTSAPELWPPGALVKAWLAPPHDAVTFPEIFSGCHGADASGCLPQYFGFPGPISPPAAKLFSLLMGVAPDVLPAHETYRMALDSLSANHTKGKQFFKHRPLLDGNSM